MNPEDFFLHTPFHHLMPCRGIDGGMIGKNEQSFLQDLHDGREESVMTIAREQDLVLR